MITGNFKTIEELDKAYRDHIHSVEMWGGEADIDGLYAAWDEAAEQFQIDNPV